MLIDITKNAHNYSNKLTSTQLESIFKKLGVDIDKEFIKKLNKKDFLPPLNSIRYYDFKHVVIIYIVYVLKTLIKDDIIKVHIRYLFDMNLTDVIKFYDYFYKNNNLQYNNLNNDIYKLLFLTLQYNK